MKLEDYKFTYLVTSGPLTLFLGECKAFEPFDFADFEVPMELKGQVIELRIYLTEGDMTIVKSSYDQVPCDGALIKGSLNVVPLRMINELLGSRRTSRPPIPDSR